MFFDKVRLYTNINCANVALFPKVSIFAYVCDFKPIAFCSIRHKLLPKTHVFGLQQGIQSFICQLKHISFLLATKMIKGYGRGYMNPRCIIKIYLKKAYNSRKWPFIRSMMLNLDFLKFFVNWIMECILMCIFQFRLIEWETMVYTCNTINYGITNPIDARFKGT